MLDKSKPYGEIFGKYKGARYVQSGVEYKADGSPLKVSKPRRVRKVKKIEESNQV